MSVPPQRVGDAQAHGRHGRQRRPASRPSAIIERDADHHVARGQDEDRQHAAGRIAMLNEQP